MKPIKSVRAFTLIEVLIVMSLLSIMVVLLFGTLKISAESWEHGEDKISEVNEVAVVYNFFQRHLLSTKPLWDDFSEPESKVLSFQGNEQSLTFVSSFPASADRPGMQLFTVKIEDQYEPASIEVLMSPFFPANEGEEIAKEQITLVKRVKNFKLGYFGENLETGQVDWQDRWLDREILPSMVKIEIALNNGVFWPVMIFPLKITGTADLADITGATVGNEDDEDGDKLDGNENDSAAEMDSGEEQ